MYPVHSSQSLLGLLPARCDVAEVGIKQIVHGHGIKWELTMRHKTPGQIQRTQAVSFKSEPIAMNGQFAEK